MVLKRKNNFQVCFCNHSHFPKIFSRIQFCSPNSTVLENLSIGVWSCNYISFSDTHKLDKVLHIPSSIKSKLNHSLKNVTIIRVPAQWKADKHETKIFSSFHLLTKKNVQRGNKTSPDILFIYLQTI